MEFTNNIISITGHNAMCKWGDKYEIMLGGYELYKDFNGTIVLEKDVESAIINEVLQALLDIIN